MAPFHRRARMASAVMDPTSALCVPSSRALRRTLPRPQRPFIGPDGSIFLTDPGRSHLGDPTGRVWRSCPMAAAQLRSTMFDTQRLVLDDAGRHHRHRAPMRWRCRPAVADRVVHQPSAPGPDGLRWMRQAVPALAHARNGIVWLFRWRTVVAHPFLRRKIGDNIAYGAPAAVICSCWNPRRGP